ncbi:MAG: SIS domain-containing protein [Acidobacteriota bacterium]
MSHAGSGIVNRLRRVLDERAQVYRRMGECAESLAELVAAGVSCLRSGGQIIFCGNGGSAAQADHLAAELVGRYQLERPAFRALALASAGAALTSIGNDYGFDEVFARQVQGLARPGDLLIALSTSGRSPNIHKALKTARDHRCTTALLTGAHSRDEFPPVDRLLAVPSTQTPVIQEMHLLLGHLLCESIEAEMMERL